MAVHCGIFPDKANFDGILGRIVGKLVPVRARLLDGEPENSG